MGEILRSNCYGRLTLKHKKLPIYITDEFNFFRCVSYTEIFYGKTVSELHAGNLRETCGRYSSLFPGHKLSYWADSPSTARAEVKKYNPTKNIITFWAYDDYSSTFPSLCNEEPLIIVDGRKCGIQDLIDKLDQGEELTIRDREMMSEILNEKPDGIVYDSRVKKGGENYIFLEKGFNKLALREVRLRLGDRKAKNTCVIPCSFTSDYSPDVKNYGYCFMPIAQTDFVDEYLETEEYKKRKRCVDEAYERMAKAYSDAESYT